MDAPDTTHGPHNVSRVTNRVLYADTDKMGVVYHANYFRWFEAGRGTYMRRRGRPYSQTEASGYQLPLVECGIRYYRPALYEDLIVVTTWVEQISGVQVTFQYEIHRQEDLLVRGFTRHAAINTEGRPVRIPDDLRRTLSISEQTTEPPF